MKTIATALVLLLSLSAAQLAAAGGSTVEVINPNGKFLLIDVAEWRSAEDFLQALNSEEIKAIGRGFPEEMPHYPSVYEIIRE